MSTNAEEAARLAKEAADQKAAEEAAEAEKKFNEAVAAKAAEDLKDIKAKLDAAYAHRDEIQKKLREKEEAERAAELKRLQDEGKHREAYEMQKKELEEKNKALENQNIELTRNVEVRSLLSALDFRTDKAREMAFQEITGQLVRDANGQWVHKSGVALKDFVKSFSEQEANSFLFKPKVNNGGGSGGDPGSGGGGGGENKSLFARSQEEVLQMAREGKLPQRR